MTVDISVCIPTIEPRQHLLRRALASVNAQTLAPIEIVIHRDLYREGAPATRQHALENAACEWVAFLDDDDEFMPHHLDALARCAEDTGADYVYSYFTIIGPDGRELPGNDPLRTFGQPFNPAQPQQTTITTLVRRELALQVGGFLRPSDAPPTPDGHRAGEDWAFTLGCVEAGAKIVHHPERTWYWHHHGANTSGLPDRW